MRRLIIKLFLCINLILLLSIPTIVLADDPTPPPPPGGHGETGNQGPTGAPIDGGLAVFMAFAAGYAAREWYKRNRQEA
jgi:hypothetical protein